MKRSVCRPLAIAALCLSLLSVCAPLYAADLKPDDSPETVLRESYRRMQANDWPAAADTFDPAALKQFRDMLAPILDAGEGAAVLPMLFGPAQTPDSLKTMSDQAFFAGLISSMMRSSGGTLEGQDVVGGVAEGPERMHMVVRSKAAAMGITMTQMEVVTLNKTAEGWRLALSGKMEGMAQALQMFRAKAKPDPVESQN
jgi:hypothetical protein